MPGVQVKSMGCQQEQRDRPRRKRHVTEPIGLLICGLGLTFALGLVLVSYSEKQVERQKGQVQQAMAEMKSELSEAAIPKEQRQALLQVHRDAMIRYVTCQHFILLSFFVLLSLLVASVGLTLMVHGKLRAFSPRED